MGNFLFLFFTVAKQRDPKSKQTTVSTWAKLSPKFVSFGSELEVWSCATENRRPCIEKIRHDCLPILLVAAIVVIVPLFFCLCFVSCPISCKCFFTPELSQLPDREQSQTTVPPCLGFKAQRGSRSSVSTRFASFFSFHGR